MIVREQYLESCPVHLAIFLRERKPKDLNELAILSEQYVDAHASSNKAQPSYLPKKSVYKGHLSPDGKKMIELTGMQNQKQKEHALLVERLDILQRIVGWQDDVSIVERLDILIGIVFSQRKLQQ